jgi:hypothetical protein
MGISKSKAAQSPFTNVESQPLAVAVGEQAEAP